MLTKIKLLGQNLSPINLIYHKKNPQIRYILFTSDDLIASLPHLLKPWMQV